MSEKKYYWMKFQREFFKSLRIKKLRRLAGGDTYTIIFLRGNRPDQPAQRVFAGDSHCRATSSSAQRSATMGMPLTA